MKKPKQAKSWKPLIYNDDLVAAVFLCELGNNCFVALRKIKLSKTKCGNQHTNENLLIQL